MSTQRNILAVIPRFWMRTAIAVFAVAAVVSGTVATTAGSADAPRRTGATPPRSGGGEDSAQALHQPKGGAEHEGGAERRNPSRHEASSKGRGGALPESSAEPTAPPLGASGAGRSGVSTAASTMACGAAFKPERDGESYQDALAREDDLLGGLDVARVYYSGAPNQWPGKLDTGGRPIIVSFKLQPNEVLAGTHDAHLRTWFNEAPSDRDTYWVYYHEPEDNIEKGDFSAADYRAAWRHIAGLADQAGNNRLLATLTLMGYSVEPASTRDWRDYYPGPETVDVMAWDIYNYVNEGGGGYRDPATLFGRAASVSRSEGLPFAVAETGSAIASGDDGSGRAEWVRNTLTYLRQQDAVFVSYFDMYIEANHGKQHYELRDQNSQAAYREVCS